MCDGTNNTTNPNGAMVAGRSCTGPLSHLTPQQLDHELITSHERVHAQLDALDAVYGPGATATLRAALNAQWTAEGEHAHRVGDARARAEGVVDLLTAELAHVSREVDESVAAVAEVIGDGIGRYPKGKVPQWAKDASVAATKAQGSAGNLAHAAERAKTVNDSINPR